MSNINNPYALGGQAAGLLGVNAAPMQSSSFSIPSAPYGTIGAGLLQLGFAIPAMIQASKAKYQQYGLTPQMAKSLSEADTMAQYGFMPSEMASYNQQLGQDRSATFSRARELSGGNLAASMMAILSGQNVNARNQLATQGASLRRQNIANRNALNATTQELSNMNTNMYNDNVMRQKQAAAQLMQSAIGNLGQGGNLIAGMML